MPPVRRNALIERMMPNTSDACTVCTLPFSSGRSSSSSLPRATTTSWLFGALKLPQTAAVIALLRWSVRL